MSEGAMRNSSIRRLITPAAISVWLLLIMLGVFVLSGCNFWAEGPEGKVFLVTIPDQAAMTFLNRFSAGMAQLHATLDALNEPRLGSLLQQVETSFRRLDRDIGRNSPAHPVDLAELRQGLSTLIQAIENQPRNGTKLAPALAQAKELQRLTDDFASTVQAGLGVSLSTNGNDGQETLPVSQIPSCVSWYEGSDGSISRVAVPEQELTAFVNEFTSIVGQLSMILNALNSPQLIRLLEQVKASFRKVQRDMQSGSPATPVDLADLRQRLSLLNQAIDPYPCHGTQSRLILDQQTKELQRLVDAFTDGITDGRCNQDDQGDGALQAHIAGGNRSVCLGDPQFSALGSIGPIVQYLWDFGDGRTATGPTVNHEYRRPGDYTVTLTVVDREGHTDKDSILVVVRYC
jgi:hypothetical protein